MKKILYAVSLCWMCLADATEFRPEATAQWQLQAELPLTEAMRQLQQEIRRGAGDASKLQLAHHYLTGARRPGYDDWFHQAEQLLQDISGPASASASYYQLLADIQQQQHQFAEALTSLDKVFQLQANDMQASLMAARVHLAMDQTEAARRACGRLWQQDLFLFSVCQYEVAGRQGQWQQSYAALSQLWQRQRGLPTELDIWLRGILAEQAEQLGLTATAMQWLEPILAQAPTSIWLKWADLNLALGQAASVYQQLSVLPTAQLSDSLLVRLARAEQQLGKARDFQQRLTQRMQLRLARGDTEHAADVANYFLYIVADAKAALKWAERNYQTAKEPDDKQLLMLSRMALNNETGVE